MVRKEYYKGKAVFICGQCNFGYAAGELARNCEDYCRKHRSCSLEITRKAVKKG